MIEFEKFTKIFDEIVIKNNKNFMKERYSLDERIWLFKDILLNKNKYSEILNDYDDNLLLFSNFFTNDEALEIINKNDLEEKENVFCYLNCNDLEKEKYINSYPIDSKGKDILIDTLSDNSRKERFKNRFLVKEYVEDLDLDEKLEYIELLSNYNRSNVIATLDDEYKIDLVNKYDIVGIDLFHILNSMSDDFLFKSLENNKFKIRSHGYFKLFDKLDAKQQISIIIKNKFLLSNEEFMEDFINKLSLEEVYNLLIKLNFNKDYLRLLSIDTLENIIPLVNDSKYFGNILNLLDSDSSYYFVKEKLFDLINKDNKTFMISILKDGYINQMFLDYYDDSIPKLDADDFDKISYLRNIISCGYFKYINKSHLYINKLIYLISSLSKDSIKIDILNELFNADILHHGEEINIYKNIYFKNDLIKLELIYMLGEKGVIDYINLNDDILDCKNVHKGIVGIYAKKYNLNIKELSSMISENGYNVLREIVKNNVLEQEIEVLDKGMSK